MSRSETGASLDSALSSTRFEALCDWLEARMSELDIPGAAVGVVVGNQRFSHAIGVASADSGDAFTTSTRFGIASLTKIFTATALALLSQEGAVNLDEPVRNHLPRFSLAESDATEAATVGHLISHAGGWADALEPVPGQDSLAWYATQMASLPQIVPVGAHFSYSNSGFMLAGAIIEQITGVPFEEAISRTILRPLGMDHTGFRAIDDPSINQAVGHQITDGELESIPLAEIPRAILPAGGLLSNIEDMLTFVQAHASHDPGRLNVDALASMRHPRNTGGSVGPVVVDHIGAGWMLLDIEGETVLMSQGGDSGLIAAMIAVPARQFGVVILANSDSAMMLVNEAVLRGLSHFTELTLPESAPYMLSNEEATNAEGKFGLQEWMTFKVTRANGALLLATSAGGEEISDLSGLFTMTSPTQGFMPYLGGRIWLDLVPDDAGSIQWLRFAARLVPRMS